MSISQKEKIKFKWQSMAGSNFLSLKLLIRPLNEKTRTEVQSRGYVYPSNYRLRKKLGTLACIRKEVGIIISIAAMLTIAHRWKLPKCPSVREWKIKYGISIYWNGRYQAVTMR